MSAHVLVAEALEADLYQRYPHAGDCTGTLCTACGCCCHCQTDGHCEGTVGCSDQDCMCPDLVGGGS